MIGVRDSTKIVGSGFDSFKRDLLFFDHLVLLGAEPGLRVLRQQSDNKYRQLGDELEYLLETPFFESLTPTDILEPIKSPTSAEESSVNSAIEWVWQLDKKSRELEKLLDGGRSSELLKSILHLKESQVSIMSRLEARRLSKRGRIATSNEPMPLGAPCLSDAPAVGDVIQLSINLVPVPDGTVPWEDIFALKQDREVTERARKLRLWASEQVGSGKDLNFLSEKIKDMVADYERVVRAHRVKLQPSVIRSVVVGAAGLLEDICKLRFEKAAERIFSAKAAKADMLLAEASAPGLELSLITLLKDRLSSA